jgi:predicted transcriptional regulator
MEKLTSQEEELMLIIWQQERGFVRDFRKKMNVQQPYTTVASIVKNLEHKNYVSSKLYGNAREYTPIVSENDYKTKFMSNVVRNYFENSYKELVSFFVEKEKISAEELQEIIKLIERK